MPPSWGCIIKSCVNSSHCQSLYPLLIILYLQKLKVVKTQVVLATDECHNILKFGIRGKRLSLHMPSWTSYLQRVNCKFHNVITTWLVLGVFVRVSLVNSLRQYCVWSSGDMTILEYLLKALKIISSPYWTFSEPQCLWVSLMQINIIRYKLLTISYFWGIFKQSFSKGFFGFHSSGSIHCKALHPCIKVVDIKPWIWFMYVVVKC